MKEMIKRVREEKGGFTLAELLIVVAIILVLVAVAVPVFTAQLDNANAAVVNADIRSAKAEAAADHMSKGTGTAGTYKYKITPTGDMTKATDADAVQQTFDEAKNAVRDKKNVVVEVAIDKDGVITSTPAASNPAN